MSSQVSRIEYETLIFTFRGKKVMVDYDLALLYEVPTKELKPRCLKHPKA